jgi:hypothetical protein
MQKQVDAVALLKKGCPNLVGECLGRIGLDVLSDGCRKKNPDQFVTQEESELDHSFATGRPCSAEHGLEVELRVTPE